VNKKLHKKIDSIGLIFDSFALIVLAISLFFVHSYYRFLQVSEGAEGIFFSPFFALITFTHLNYSLLDSPA
jgi:hypothetical protein